jgi:hypothetical protein
VADASTTRRREIMSDALPETAAPRTPKPPDSAPIELAQNTRQTCADFIAANCKASILRVFPGEYPTQSLQDVINAAKRGDRAAQSARKLLFNNEYRKP